MMTDLRVTERRHRRRICDVVVEHAEKRYSNVGICPEVSLLMAQNAPENAPNDMASSGPRLAQRWTS